MITAQEAFSMYGKYYSKEEHLEMIYDKIKSICTDETSLEVKFLFGQEIKELEDNGFSVEEKKDYFLISWDMEAWKHW